MKEIRVRWGSGTDIAGEVYYTTTHDGIQKAVDYAHSKGGGNIFIEKGVYSINNTSNTGDGAYSIKLYSNITLIGEGLGTILKPAFTNTNSNACVISAVGISDGNELRNITIKDLVIGGIEDTSKGYIGIYCSHVGSSLIKEGITIENCIIKNNSDCGILLNYSCNCIITGNICTKNNYQGISLITLSSNNIITNNICCNNFTHGILLDSSNNNIITNNICNNNSNIGIYLHNSNNKNNIIGNNCSNNNNLGIHSYGESNNNNIVGNNCSNNLNQGMSMYNSSYNNIVGNVCNYNRDYELHLNNAHRNAIIGNINRNSKGICLYSSSSNSVIGNIQNLISNGGSNNIIYN